MRSVIRCLKAEFLKYRHCALLYIHVVVPVLGAVIFASYFKISGWDAATKISAYLEALAIATPFLIGIIVGTVTQNEYQAGHYQLILGTIPSRSAAYIGKLGVLFIGFMGAITLALGIFYSLYQTGSYILYLRAGALLALTAVPIYMIHLFIGMNFGKGASMGMGIAGSLITALMITGMGDAVWKYIPWAWGARFMDYMVLAWHRPALFLQMEPEFMSGIWITVICAGSLFIASLAWFRYWEGGKGND